MKKIQFFVQGDEVNIPIEDAQTYASRFGVKSVCGSFSPKRAPKERSENFVHPDKLTECENGWFVTTTSVAEVNADGVATAFKGNAVTYYDAQGHYLCVGMHRSLLPRS